MESDAYQEILAFEICIAHFEPCNKKFLRTVLGDSQYQPQFSCLCCDMYVLIADT